MGSLQDCLNCPLCMEYCKDAVECLVCQNLFCKDCTNDLNNNNKDKCPLCRQDTQFKASQLGRRLINSIPTQCEDCQQITTIGELNNHKEKCIESRLECSLCETSVKKGEYLDHLSNNHFAQISDKLPIINETLAKTKEQLKYEKLNLAENSIDCQNNSYSKKTARLGSTGKYYCTGRLDGNRCFCCNGSCGPTHGCNCSGCMELDIKYRRLPKGWLVNSDGFAAKKSPQTALFYCGRKVMPTNNMCDGYCGPNNGPNCESCQRLDYQAAPNGRYVKLL